LPCFLLGVVDSYSIQQNAAVVKLKLLQFGDISMLDYDDIVCFVSEPDRQIKMYGYLWTVSFVDHSVIAHSTNKRTPVPMAKHTVADPVFGPVTFFVEVV